jgi:hypothetical protein
MNPFPLILHTGLDAEVVGVSYDDLLFSFYILHAADAWAAAREAPETLTLDALHRVAWWLGIDLRVEMVPRKAAP